LPVGQQADHENTRQGGYGAAQPPGFDDDLRKGRRNTSGKGFADDPPLYGDDPRKGRKNIPQRDYDDDPPLYGDDPRKGRKNIPQRDYDDDPPLYGDDPQKGRRNIPQRDYDDDPPAGYRDSHRLDPKGTVSGISGAVKKLPVKKILMVAVPVIIVIIIAIIAIPRIGGGSAGAVRDNISFFGDRDEILISGNTNPKFYIDGDLESLQRNLDGSKSAVLVDYRGINGGALWFVTTTSCYKVADNVLQFRLSDSGNGVAYLKDFEAKNNSATLCLYDTAAKKETLVTGDAFFDGEQMLCISPNGKSIGFLGDYDSKTGKAEGFVMIDGKDAEKLEENTLAIAISDGGRHLYYMKMSDDGYSGSIHVRSGRNESRLASNINDMVLLMLNKDYSEALFTIEDRTFIIRNGSARERVSGAPVEGLVLPRGTQSRSLYEGGVYVYGLRTFGNLVGITNEGLIFYDSKLESNKITSSSNYRSGAVLSSDGKTLYYISNNGSLSAIDPSKPGAERREVGRDVSAFVASNDGTTVYFVNEDSELWHVKGAGTPLRIADDVSKAFMAIANNSAKVFFLVDYSSGRGGELYYSDNGGRRTRVTGADEVTRIWSTATSVFYVTRDNEIYRSGGDEKFTKFHDEIDNMW